MKEKHKTLGQDSRWPGRDLNLVSLGLDVRLVIWSLIFLLFFLPLLFPDFFFFLLLVLLLLPLLPIVLSSLGVITALNSSVWLRFHNRRLKFYYSFIQVGQSDSLCHVLNIDII